MLLFVMPVFTSQLLLLISPAALCQALPPLPVLTPQGTYHPNTSIPGVDQFLGIPYAEPPLGALRFADPQPYTSGDPSQQIDATSYGPACLQDRAFEAANGLSEDCLTLNIYRPTAAAVNPTPNTTGSSPFPLLPVLIYIYGGANIGGQSQHYTASNLVLHSLNLLHPTTNPKPQPILAVTLNYRTGGLGFLSNTLFARNNLLNAGLKDQRLALRWLRANVAAFGGDPGRMVIFGQSAGSFDVWMQVRYEAYVSASSSTTTNSSVGGGDENGRLFSGAIMESGGPGSLALRGVRPEEGDRFLEGSLRALGCPSAKNGAGQEALACLRGVGAEELMRVWYNSSSELYNTLDEFVQLPVGFGIDGEWVKSENYWDEAAAQIPMMIGDTLNEGSLYGRVPTGLATNETYLAQVVANLNLARPVLSTYYNHTAAENGRGFDADPTAPDSYYIGEAVLGDAVQDIPRRINLGRHASGADAPNNTTTTTAGGSCGGAGKQAAGGAKTWGYRWSQKPRLSLFNERFYGFPPDVPDANKIRAGVLHASELGSVFGDIYGWPDAVEQDKQLASLVQSM
ncbi:Secreted lipase [Lasiodiplodia hormozganensis]|uniref:Carboxylic ester hydrolase n=1 Tax=Lasiodiplodia hormozganensis TaxID=869390 RepID=A0AA39X667_9PEZI|nr:Secreted lipase [Lasiodiplodia hormozganensis]